MRCLLDTNVILSAFIESRGAPYKIFEHWLGGTFTLVCSDYILAEVNAKLKLPRLKKRIFYPENEVAKTVQKIRNQAVIINPKKFLKVIEADPKDDPILACALEAGADYIVSGDKHLLSLGNYKDIQITTPAKFLEIITHK